MISELSKNTHTLIRCMCAIREKEKNQIADFGSWGSILPINTTDRRERRLGIDWVVCGLQNPYQVEARSTTAAESMPGGVLMAATCSKSSASGGKSIPTAAEGCRRLLSARFQPRNFNTSAV